MLGPLKCEPGPVQLHMWQALRQWQALRMWQVLRKWQGPRMWRGLRAAYVEEPAVHTQREPAGCTRLLRRCVRLVLHTSLETRR